MPFRLHRATTGRRPARPEIVVLALDGRTRSVEWADAAGAVPDWIEACKSPSRGGAGRGAAGRPGLGMIPDDTHAAGALADLTGSQTRIASPIEVPGSKPPRFGRGDGFDATVRTRHDGPVDAPALDGLRSPGCGRGGNRTDGPAA